jgi:hypothetical protein
MTTFSSTNTYYRNIDKIDEFESSTNDSLEKLPVFRLYQRVSQRSSALAQSSFEVIKSITVDTKLIRIFSLISKVKLLDYSDFDIRDKNIFESNKSITISLLMKINYVPKVIPEENGTFTLQFIKPDKSSILVSIENEASIKMFEKSRNAKIFTNIEKVIDYCESVCNGNQ